MSIVDKSPSHSLTFQARKLVSQRITGKPKVISSAAEVPRGKLQQERR
jgi:hypothetical protein